MRAETKHERKTQRTCVLNESIFWTAREKKEIRFERYQTFCELTTKFPVEFVESSIWIAVSYTSQHDCMRDVYDPTRNIYLYIHINMYIYIIILIYIPTRLRVGSYTSLIYMEFVLSLSLAKFDNMEFVKFCERERENKFHVYEGCI